LKKVNILPPKCQLNNKKYSKLDVAFLESKLNQIFGIINIKIFKFLVDIKLYPYEWLLIVVTVLLFLLMFKSPKTSFPKF